MPGHPVTRGDSQQGNKTGKPPSHTEGGTETVQEEPARPQPYGDKETAPGPRSPPQEGQAPGHSSPLPELLEDHPVGEALAADPDALQDPVAAQLVQHEVGIQFASLEKETHAGSLESLPGVARER